MKYTMKCQLTIFSYTLLCAIIKAFTFIFSKWIWWVGGEVSWGRKVVNKSSRGHLKASVLQRNELGGGGGGGEIVSLSDLPWRRNQWGKQWLDGI